MRPRTAAASSTELRAPIHRGCCILNGLTRTMFPLLLMALAAVPLPEAVERGIAESLARERAAALTAVRYDLAFTVPERRQQPVEGSLRLTAMLASPRRIVIDFSAPKERVRSVRVGDKDVV